MQSNVLSSPAVWYAICLQSSSLETSNALDTLRVRSPRSSEGSAASGSLLKESSPSTLSSMPTSAFVIWYWM